MIALPALDELPRQNASQVKNKWGDVVRQVQQEGSLAITNHAAVEMVLLTAATYRKVVEIVRERNTRELDELARRFEERLAVLQQPDARERLDGLLASKGKMKNNRPVAGKTY
jgi:prevent-host-death family protein